MNWGWRIFLLYTSFVVFMLFMVYQCTQQNIDLVTENYYAKELKFADHYQRMQNTATQGMQVKVDFDPATKLVTLYFPQGGRHLTGEVYFFRPDNKKLDITYPIEAGMNSLQEIDCGKLTRGLWKVQVNWNAGDTGYYQEEQIFIP